MVHALKGTCQGFFVFSILCLICKAAIFQNKPTELSAVVGELRRCFNYLKEPILTVTILHQQNVLKTDPVADIELYGIIRVLTVMQQCVSNLLLWWLLEVELVLEIVKLLYLQGGSSVVPH